MAAVKITRLRKKKYVIGKYFRKNKSTMLYCQKYSFKFRTLLSLRAHNKIPHHNKEMEKRKMPVKLKEMFKDILSEHGREGNSETKSPGERESYQKKRKTGKSIFYPLVGTELSTRPWQLEIRKYMY